MVVKKETHSLIIDIGKTHIKLHILDHTFTSVFSKQMSNVVDNKGKYPSVDTTNIWLWLKEGIKNASCLYQISSITITTHGATAALIDRNSKDTDGLVLPILDYEYQGVESINEEYKAVRPNFDESYSPNLPAGLNLGKQLYWLKKEFPDSYANVTDILMYPQYWAWRFTGQRHSEITSLGCHTDLWSLKNNDFSSLVDELNCRHLFSPIQPAWFNCGLILPELRQELGLADNCHFFNGIHDSNASFLRYRLTQGSAPFTVISTGTWTILMATQVPLANLKENNDMLANIDVKGEPVACARFMGGREFECICEKLGALLTDVFNEADIQNIINEQVFALPSFSEGSGPFGFNEGCFIGDINHINGIALATLYCALIVDYQLDQLASKGSIFIEGAFLKNPLLCAILNQLRSHQEVFLSQDTTGTVQGAAYLTSWEEKQCNIDVELATNTKLNGLSVYKELWLKHIRT